MMRSTLKFKLIFSQLVLVAFLSGCAPMNSDFDCAMQPGVMCKSLDQVNAMVNRGELGRSGTTIAGSCHTCGYKEATKCVKKFYKSTCYTNKIATPYPIAEINPGDPLRYGETVMRVWMAPYEDTTGNYYQPSVFYTVIKPGHWIGNPVKSICDDED